MSNENTKDTKKPIPFRVNMQMSQEMVDFYQNMADSMGVARSTCMVLGLKTYMDQQLFIELSKKVQ